MRTRRSHKNQEKLWKDIGKQLSKNTVDDIVHKAKSPLEIAQALFRQVMDDPFSHQRSRNYFRRLLEKEEQKERVRKALNRE